mmetsp:Transcript_15908/g.20195  ORF Transcript_15908/g.20195 Transcript_15908/m.20195 type:complete len:339 (+) Transcript_15908:110-1126(+)
MIRSVALHLLLILALFTTTLLHNASAFPGAAGHCQTGDLSGKFSGHGESGGGPISNGSLRVKFGTTTLQTWTTTKLVSDQTYTVTLDFTTSSTNFFFRGFLFRLSGTNGENAEGSFSLSGDSNVQFKSCDAGISGVTHNSRADKRSISFDFEYTQSIDADLLLEVTVVRERAADNWFYSAFNLQIGDGGTTVTPAPVPVVTSTVAPSNAPFVAPTETTPSPVVAPAVAPSCNDPPFRFRVVKPDGSKIWRDCLWVKTKSTQWRCSWEGVSTMCPVACGTCSACVDSTARFKFDKDPDDGTRDLVTRDCSWTANRATAFRCTTIEGMQDACRETCGSCT